MLVIGLINPQLGEAKSNLKRHFVTLNDVPIQGRILDSDGTPLEGVTISVSGSALSTSSDAQGRYVINAPNDTKALIFTIIGYESSQQEIGSRSTIDVTLVKKMDTLEEVVVVGYGTMQKKDLTGSVVQILPDKIANENPKTVHDNLRGTPGLNVGFSSSAKGGGSMQIPLSKASQLLLNGEYKIYEIADILGFSTASHFSRNFQKYFGVNPKNYQTK